MELRADECSPFPITGDGSCEARQGDKKQIKNSNLSN